MAYFYLTKKNLTEEHSKCSIINLKYLCFPM